MIFLIFERSIHRPKNLTDEREIAFIFLDLVLEMKIVQPSSKKAD